MKKSRKIFIKVKNGKTTKYISISKHDELNARQTVENKFKKFLHFYSADLNWNILKPKFFPYSFSELSKNPYKHRYYTINKDKLITDVRKLDIFLSDDSVTSAHIYRVPYISSRKCIQFSVSDYMDMLIEEIFLPILKNTLINMRNTGYPITFIRQEYLGKNDIELTPEKLMRFLNNKLTNVQYGYLLSSCAQTMFGWYGNPNFKPNSINSMEYLNCGITFIDTDGDESLISLSLKDEEINMLNIYSHCHAISRTIKQWNPITVRILN